MKINFFYIFIFIFLGGLLFVTKKVYRGSGRSWVGVAEARVFNISSEKQATVQSIRVVQGQSIKKGDTLIMLSSLMLSNEIERMENRVFLLQSQKLEQQKLLSSEIELARSMNAVDVSQLEKEITLAESELKLNKSLTNDLKTGGTQNQTSPLDEKVKALKTEIALRTQTLQLKINDFTTRNKIEQSLLQNQISLLEGELLIYRQERKNLIKVSMSDGVVEAVLVKSGEEVNAYINLITVLPKTPSAVVAYLQTNVEIPAIGTKVQMTSYDARLKTLEGKVIGFGSIVPLPDILQKATAVRAFGKEVFIDMPAENNFSTGEKMLIRLWEK